MYTCSHRAEAPCNVFTMHTQIQKMVISGGDFKPDTLKTKEMVSLLLDDEEMKSRCEHTMCIGLTEG